MRILFGIGIFLYSLLSTAQESKMLTEQLSEIFERNLVLRSQVMPILQKHGSGSIEMDSLNQLIEEFDSVSLTKVVAVLEENGWLGISEVGEKANQTLFLVIQHASDNSLRKRFFPMLKASAQRGESDLASMATMKDRILIQDGKMQLYGTQSRFVNGKLEYLPTQDPVRVNKRRRKVGLKRIKLN